MSLDKKDPKIVFSVESTTDEGFDEEVEQKLKNGKDKIPMENLPLYARENRYSTASRVSINSRPSFAGISSRPSMASLRSTLTKMNLELYPERGSFVATSLGQSLAEMPQIAKKLYIITQVLAAISVSIGSMAVGFSAAYTSPAFASMDADNTTLTLTSEEKSWAGSLMPLSALFGSLAGGYFLDAIGRKMLILCCGPPFFAAYIIIGSSTSAIYMYIGRAICGLCIGILSLSLPVYLAETIQPEIRGALGLLPTTIGNSGILICYLAGTFANWWILAFIGAGIPFIFFCLMVFVPETPRWYVSKGRDEDAHRSLQWLRGSDNDVEFELAAIQENFDSSLQQAPRLIDLVQKRYLKPLAISISLMLIQQFSGINAVIFYTVSIFEMSGSTIDQNVSTIIVGVVNLLSTFVATALIDRLGRKILLYISDVSMIISLFSLALFFYFKDTMSEELRASLGWIPLVSFMLYVIAFSLGWGPIPWLFMGEALPAQIRGPAASIATSINWTCTFVITLLFQQYLELYGPAVVFSCFGGTMILGLFLIIFFVPETKGKTLEEIEAEISGRVEHKRQRRISEMSGIFIK